jgi:Tfp pilus assembly protein PilX
MGKQAGQILLIVILVVIVASTIGLSLASRSITNLRSSTEEAESQKALNAAEAGIERTIQSNVLPTGIYIKGSNSSNNTTYTTHVEQVQNSSFSINGGIKIPKDEGADVWFVNHDSNGNPDYSSAVTFNNYLHLYWGSPTETCGTANSPAAIQAIVITRNSGTSEIKSYRYAYDSCSRGNNFTTSESGNFTATEHKITGVSYGNRTPEIGDSKDLAKNISDINNRIILIRVVPIYKDSVIGVYACSRAGANCTVLPLQGYRIDSTGISGEANRKIRVFKGWPEAYLPYLSYGLFVAN